MILTIVLFIITSMKTYINKNTNGYLMFSDYKILLYDIFFYFRDRVNHERIEVMPMVYISKVKHNIFESIVNLIYKKDIEYELDIQNNVNIVYYVDCDNKNNESNKYQDLNSGFQIVPTKYIAFSGYLEGNSRCGIYAHFNKIGWTGNSEYKYYSYFPFSVDEMLLLTENNSRINQKICLNFDRCKRFLPKVLNRTYLFENYDDTHDKDKSILLEYSNGIFIVWEGKHRCCAFKRFGYDFIEANVSINNRQTKEKFSTYEPINLNYWKWSLVTDKFYEFFKDNYNLDKQLVQKLFSQSNASTFIDNFEKQIGKDIV